VCIGRPLALRSLRTKLAESLADQLTDIVTDGVVLIHQPGQPIDLHMVRHACRARIHTCATRAQGQGHAQATRCTGTDARARVLSAHGQRAYARP
jgi:hypothetical protein